MPASPNPSRLSMTATRSGSFTGLTSGSGDGAATGVPSSPSSPTSPSSASSPRRGLVQFGSQVASPSPRSVPRLTALRLQQKLVEAEQENQELRAHAGRLQKQLAEADLRVAQSSDLSARLFREVETLSEAKTRLDDENQRSRVALSATSRSVVQTLMEKEKAEVLAENRLQGKIQENMRLVEAAARLRQQLEEAMATAADHDARAARLQRQVADAERRQEELEHDIARRHDAYQGLVLSAREEAERSDSALASAEARALAREQQAAERARQVALAAEIQQQRDQLLNDTTQRVRVLEDTSRRLEGDNAALKASVAQSARQLTAAREQQQRTDAALDAARTEATRARQAEERLTAERDAVVSRAVELEADLQDLQDQLQQEQDQHQAERARTEELTAEMKGKVGALLSVSYELGYREYEDSEMLNRSILSAYGGWVPTAASLGDKRSAAAAAAVAAAGVLGREAQSMEELEETANVRPTPSPAARRVLLQQEQQRRRQQQQQQQTPHRESRGDNNVVAAPAADGGEPRTW
jgi:hypothetical protein